MLKRINPDLCLDYPEDTEGISSSGDLLHVLSFYATTEEDLVTLAGLVLARMAPLVDSVEAQGGGPCEDRRLIAMVPYLIKNGMPPQDMLLLVEQAIFSAE